MPYSVSDKPPSSRTRSTFVGGSLELDEGFRPCAHRASIGIDTIGKRRRSALDKGLILVMDGNLCPGHFTDVAERCNVIPMPMCEEDELDITLSFFKLITNKLIPIGATIDQNSPFAAQKKAIANSNGDAITSQSSFPISFGM